jgi:hypothetical protein
MVRARELRDPDSTSSAASEPYYASEALRLDTWRRRRLGIDRLPLRYIYGAELAPPSIHPLILRGVVAGEQLSHPSLSNSSPARLIT